MNKWRDTIGELTHRALVWEKGAQQIPPLRYATVPMNKIGWAGFASSLVGPSFGGKAHHRSLHFATPEFLSRLVALANFMRLSLMKAAHVDLSDMAKQEFGYATVGMTNLLEGRA